MVAVPSTMMPLGSTAPDFALPQPGGSVVRIPKPKENSGLLIMFLSNHCPYVKHLQKELAVVSNWAIDEGIAVFGIMSNDVSRYPDDAPQKMAAEAERCGYKFPYLYDEDQSVARAYRAACTPDFFLFDAEHRLVYRGQFDESRPGNGTEVTGADLRDAIGALLKGDAISENQRPSIGCSIKWIPGQEPEWFPS